MKIWQKLVIGFGATSFLLGTIAILGIKVNNKVQSTRDEIVYGIVEEAKGAGEIFNSIQKIQRLNQDLLLEKLLDSEENKFFQVSPNQIKLELGKLEKNIIESQRATIEQKSIIHSSKEMMLTRKAVKISGETEEIVQMTKLLAEIQNYQRDWQLFLERKESNNEANSLYLIKEFSNRMNQVIYPLVAEHYQDSLSEIIESELRIQQVTNENITKINNYIILALALTCLLFIYIYRSIYTSIRWVKLATFHLGLDLSKYQPIQPNNPDDELGGLIKYFNHTIENLKKKNISKFYLDSIINSLGQSLIILDNANKIERINRNAIETLSYSESELIGKPIADILAPDNSLETNKLVNLENFSSQYLTLDFLTKKLEKKSFTVYFSDLCDSEGKKQGTICLAMQSEAVILDEIVNFQKTQENYNNDLN